jgi:hypothetical protein
MRDAAATGGAVAPCLRHARVEVISGGSTKAAGAAVHATIRDFLRSHGTVSAGTVTTEIVSLVKVTNSNFVTGASRMDHHNPANVARL